MRKRTPRLDWIATVLGETAENRGREKRPMLRLVSGAAVAPQQDGVRPVSLELVRARRGSQQPPKAQD